MRPCRRSSVLVSILIAQLLAQAPKASYEPAPEEIAQIREGIAQLKAQLDSLRAADDLKVDIGIYLKAAEWILRHPEEFYTREYYENTLAALRAGLERVHQVRTNGVPQWPWLKGRVARAYRSQVDGSLQPYVIHVPSNYGTVPMRMDVWLHGRSANMNEVSFLAGPKKPRPETQKPYFVLEVFGRTNNAYRWAGEADVFEAIVSVQQRYNIRPDQIVLRGFSMGGAGAWHIGLHHPCLWAAMEAGAGFNETRRYAKVKELAAWQEPLLNIYDAYLYARNAYNLPVVGYGGEIDPQLQASKNVQEQLRSENLPPADLRALFLVGPQTAHKWHPDSQKESEDFINKQLASPRARDRIRFVTYTTRYNRCDWLTVDGLEKHFERAEVDAKRSGEVTTRNVSRLTLTGIPNPVIDGQKLTGAGSWEKRDGKWRAAHKSNGLRKRRGLQGPIDDAFIDGFLCVNPPEKFAKEWAKWFRGDLRTKEAGAVTAQDMRDYNLALFGDPESNELIAKIARKLPVTWNRKEIVAGQKRFSAAEHTLALIYPNPLAPDRYVVLNSGNTFGEREFRGTNALLYPRLADWAVIRKSDGAVVTSGFFDESWRLPEE